MIRHPTSTNRLELPDGFIETGTFRYRGKEYPNGGALVTDSQIIVYPGEPSWEPGAYRTTTRQWAPAYYGGVVSTWDGAPLGRYVITGYSNGWRDELGRRTKLTCYRVVLDDGRRYHGRGLGPGIALKCVRGKDTPRKDRNTPEATRRAKKRQRLYFRPLRAQQREEARVKAREAEVAKRDSLWRLDRVARGLSPETYLERKAREGKRWTCLKYPCRAKNTPASLTCETCGYPRRIL